MRRWWPRTLGTFRKITWLVPSPARSKVGDVPHEEVRRRWITAVDQKAKKLKKYRAKGIVGDSDAYIICCKWLPAWRRFHSIMGYHKLPYAVEAVYPVGPITVPIDRETHKFGTPYIAIQWAIRKREIGEPVPNIDVSKQRPRRRVIAATSDRSETLFYHSMSCTITSPPCGCLKDYSARKPTSRCRSQW